MTRLDDFRQASTGRQLAVAGGLVMVILLVLIAIWYAFFRTVYLPVFSDLQPADAATIVSELEKDKIAYRLGSGGTQILVREDEVDATRVKIMGSELPFRGTVGLELFGKSDMGMTDFAQKINYQRALQGEIARTIMAIDGVDSARVHLALGENRVFRDDRVPPKASIMIKMRSSAALPAASVDGIRRLVAAAIDQLDANDVVVLDEHGAVLGAQLPLATADGAGLSPTVAARNAIDSWYEARIRDAVGKILRPDRVEVEVRSAPLPPSPGFARSVGGAAWSPATREFSLTVAISPHDQMSEQDLDRLRNAVREAIGFDAAKGDTITVGAWNRPIDPSLGPVAVTGPQLPQLASGPRFSESATDNNTILFATVFLVAVCAFVAGMLLLVVRSRRRRGLGDAERIAFAERLNTLLKDGGEVQGYAPR
jgi:flagellar M-ring protein FliF